MVELLQLLIAGRGTVPKVTCLGKRYVFEIEKEFRLLKKRLLVNTRQIPNLPQDIHAQTRQLEELHRTAAINSLSAIDCRDPSI